MRILVTGATGFLGGAVARALLGRGDEVIGLGRDAAKLGALRSIGVRTIVADLTGVQAGLPDLAADVCVHCAALSSPWGSRAAFDAANIEGTRTALALARAAGCRRFVHVSTPSVYFRFADQIAVREDSPLPPPVNAYAASKRAAEALVLEAIDLDPIILRPRGLYGAGDTALLPRLMRAARNGPLPLLNGGRAATDLTHVDDVVAAVTAAVDVPPSPRKRVFNVSGGAELNVREVVERCANRLGFRARWRALPVTLAVAYGRAAELLASTRPGRPEPAVTAYGMGLFAYTQTLDLSAAAEHLAWRPRISFDDGMTRTFEGHA